MNSLTHNDESRFPNRQTGLWTRVFSCGQTRCLCCCCAAEAAKPKRTINRFGRPETHRSMSRSRVPNFPATFFRPAARWLD